MAELLYRAASEYNTLGSVTVTNTSAPFFTYFAPTSGAVTGTAYKHNSKQFKAIISSLEGWGDAFLRRVKYNTSSDGHLAEEFNRDTGAPQGAADLTWSYASVLTAAFARSLVTGNGNYIKNLASLA